LEKIVTKGREQYGILGREPPSLPGKGPGGVLNLPPPIGSKSPASNTFLRMKES